MKEISGFYAGTDMFSIVTVEGIEYTFEATTGDLLFEEAAKPSLEAGPVQSRRLIRY